MSIAVPIKNLQLRGLLHERVFVKWVDESGKTFTLGSRLHDNKQTPDFFMDAYCDTEGQIHIHFKLQVFVMLGGKKKQRDILLVVPPDADFANASTPCPISSIDGLSHDVSTIHEAGLSNAQHVLLIQFNLTTKGFVVTEKRTTPIRPHTMTTNTLIRGLESLSNTKIFSVYIRPSTYAKVNLKELGMHISKTATDARKTNLKEMYIQQGAMLLEWNKIVYKEEQRPIPPPYAQPCPEVQVPRSPPLYAQPCPEVQVPRSPPLYTQLSPEAQLSQSSLVIFKETIEGTPPRSPTSSNCISVHGIFSGCEESSESSDRRVNLDDIEKDIRIDFNVDSDEELANLDDIEKDIRIDFDVDSDEEELAKEQFANLNSRELNQQFDYDLKVSQMLKSKLEKWMETVLPINFNVHHHTRLTTKLSILGNCVRTSNTRMFDVTLLWCFALFLYDPLDSDLIILSGYGRREIHGLFEI
ncbi:predicted protein [Sclerotinia sclerotiorum 1980 UF-70]|uniref:Uncharacterized protein n=1 Tax=Sclerotinia sclerotiorum (strain ATCC 18683 / 1980 / Ss-1) TaxID=665079 RepID=A7E596_SCLS1|nr:predicted protein [Sclerotinia sclerotiorum 1980 UF-70]EDN91068.1 predicted protein [Sclerotinia sclerotiorum 1980 UF-70]